MVQHEKGTIAFQLKVNEQEESLTVEELVSMQLQYAKKISEDFSGTKIKDVVINVREVIHLYLNPIKHLIGTSLLFTLRKTCHYRSSQIGRLVRQKSSK
jgi:hypothetical protein